MSSAVHHKRVANLGGANSMPRGASAGRGVEHLPFAIKASLINLRAGGAGKPLPSRVSFAETYAYSSLPFAKIALALHTQPAH